MATVFETQTCGRCGGSGHYSYCQRYGTMCFGCNGTGRKLTKRGAAAKDFLTKSMERLASEIKAGQYVWEILGARRRWYKVAAVVEDDTTIRLNPDKGYIKLDLGRGSIYTFRNKLIAVVDNEADRQRKLDEALEYQETLTKAGKPRKRAA